MVPWLLTVGVGMPTRPTMPRISASESVARIALPTPVSCRLARRPTSVNIRIACGRRLLRDVDHLVALQQSHVGGLPQLADQQLQLRLGDAAELLAGQLPERDQTRTEGVPARRQLARIAQGDAGAQQSVDGRHRQLGRTGQIAERDLTAGVGDRLQQLEDALDRLDGARAGLAATCGHGNPLVGPLRSENRARFHHTEGNLRFGLPVAGVRWLDLRQIPR